MADRCTTRGCRCVIKRDGLCLSCLAAEAWKQVDELPPRLAWLDLGRLERCNPQPGWERNGACYKQGNTRAFYPEAKKNAPDAKARCARCPARYACLAVALAQGEDHGIWGGTSRVERSKISRALASRRAAAA